MSAGIEGDETLVSPSKKRPAPDYDDDVAGSKTPTKVAKATPDSSVRSSPNASMVDATSPTVPTSLSARQSSPALSVLTTVSNATAAILGEGDATGSGSGSALAASQKRKRRTKEELEQEQAEKEARRKEREKEKEERKQKREEEELVRKEAQQKRAEEREEKRREADLKKQAKELEKQKKVEEQESIAKKQLRINSFFATRQIVSGASPRRQTTLQVANVSISGAEPSTEALPTAEEDPAAEYKATFLPFSLPSHSQLAPINRFLDSDDVQSLHDLQNSLDSEQDINNSKLPFGSPIRRGFSHVPVKDIIDQLQGSSANHPIDLTADPSITNREHALEMLGNTHLKYLHFHEDVRPPYCGTWTKTLLPKDRQNMSRDPCHFKYNVINYDYDSEVEWEEPEEGEDIVSEDEDASDDGDDDMDGFLDDEGAPDPASLKRIFTKGDLNPVNSGILWEDEKGVLRCADGSDKEVDLSEFQMGFLLTPAPITVDPFSTVYWQRPSTVAAAAASSSSSIPANPFIVQRGPLVDKTQQANSIHPGPPTEFKIPQVKRLIPTADLVAFKDVVDGSDLTKVAMIEHLKKMFPKLTKDALANTLDTVAKREGKKASAKWQVLK